MSDLTYWRCVVSPRYVKAIDPGCATVCCGQPMEPVEVAPLGTGAALARLRVALVNAAVPLETLARGRATGVSDALHAEIEAAAIGIRKAVLGDYE